ncbi:hypothetical protein [Actinomycetospora sp. TBRC 11914]|uniref:hypothetical protein n=1 Tax=Actinomycetospora sp. TBRC 11914 TaxID=2729387 RepID=UPI00145D0088|nr:hypothetical protein [Actinomycetospora sp. TBRC 11914]NMO92731.1 hypothetical protein [Actinomycetospora sp. TBRC 11914]
MQIGPVRRRFTAEPATSPVPGDAAPTHEPTAAERAPRTPATERDTVEIARSDHA